MNEEIINAITACNEELKNADSSLLNAMSILLRASYELHSHVNVLIEIREDLTHTQQAIESALADLNNAKQKATRIKYTKPNTL